MSPLKSQSVGAAEGKGKKLEFGAGLVGDEPVVKTPGVGDELVEVRDNLKEPSLRGELNSAMHVVSGGMKAGELKEGGHDKKGMFKHLPRSEKGMSDYQQKTGNYGKKRGRQKAQAMDVDDPRKSKMVKGSGTEKTAGPADRSYEDQ